jgi:hypothetical protein
MAAPDSLGRMRPGLRVFAFSCGLLAAALCVAVLRPGIIRSATQAAELRPYAYIMAGVLCIGGVRALIPRGDDGRGRGALTAMTATLVFVFGILGVASPIIDLKSTKDLAEVARALVRPGDRIYHYHGFFHDFTYYSAQTVGLVDYRDELETQFLGADELKSRFIDDAQFRKLWAGPARIFAVARIRDSEPLVDDPVLHFHILASSQTHYLFSNQP